MNLEKSDSQIETLYNYWIIDRIILIITYVINGI